MTLRLSYSQLNTYSRCGMQWFYRYVEGWISKPGIALVVGSGAHGGVELDMRTKLETGELASAEAVEAAAADTLDARVLGEGVDLEGVTDERSVALGKAKDQAVALARCHHDKIAPMLHPTHVERGFTLKLPPNERRDEGVDLEGWIDLQDAARLPPLEEGGEERTAVCVRDFKTSAKKPAKNAADASVQLTAYHLAVTALDGKPPDLLSLDVVTKTKVPAAHVLYTKRTREHHGAFVQRVDITTKGIRAGVFLPTTDDRVCNARFCGYFRRCPWGERARPKPAGETMG